MGEQLVRVCEVSLLQQVGSNSFLVATAANAAAVVGNGEATQQHKYKVNIGPQVSSSSVK